jgi:hypothetical protein
MTFMLTVSTLLTLTLLAMFVFQWQLYKRTSSDLRKELQICQSTLHEFMHECEATLTELSRFTRKSHQALDSPGKLIRTVAVDANKKSAQTAEPARSEPITLNKKSSCEKTAKVLTLSDRGVQVAEIANQLMIPQGEIDLILNLNRK